MTIPAAEAVGEVAAPIAIRVGSTALPYAMHQCRHGAMLFHARDQYVGRSLQLYGEYGEEEVQLLLKLVRPGEVVVEAGANIGADTVPLARHLGHTGRVLAFEPQRVIFQLLSANLALNGLDNVLAYWAALSENAGTVTLPRIDYSAAFNYGGVAMQAEGEGEQVVALAIDAFRLERCALIKADVEGMERQVLLGARETIRRLRPRLYVENNGGAESPALIGEMLALGYRLYWHTPALFNPQNFVGNAQNVFPGIVSCNILGLHANDPLQVTNFRVVRDVDDVPLPRQSTTPRVDDPS